MQGVSFYFYLRNRLKPNDIVGKSSNGNDYIFLKWSVEGELIFDSSGVTKKIPMEMIIISHYVKSKEIEINYDWVCKNGKNEYCIHPVLNHLLNSFADKI